MRASVACGKPVVVNAASFHRFESIWLSSFRALYRTNRSGLASSGITVATGSNGTAIAGTIPVRRRASAARRCTKGSLSPSRAANSRRALSVGFRPR